QLKTDLEKSKEDARLSTEVKKEHIRLIKPGSNQIQSNPQVNLKSEPKPPTEKRIILKSNRPELTVDPSDIHHQHKFIESREPVKTGVSGNRDYRRIYDKSANDHHHSHKHHSVEQESNNNRRILQKPNYDDYGS